LCLLRHRSVLLAASQDGTIVGWNLQSWDEVWKKSLEGALHCLAVDKAEQLLAVGCDNGNVELLDAANGEKISVLEGNKSGRSVAALAFSPDALQLAVGEFSVRMERNKFYWM